MVIPQDLSIGGTTCPAAGYWNLIRNGLPENSDGWTSHPMS
jgi:hypothetical protein